MMVSPETARRSVNLGGTAVDANFDFVVFVQLK